MQRNGMVIVEGKANGRSQEEEVKNSFENIHGPRSVLQLFKIKPQLIISLFQVLGNDPDFGEHRHKIHISLPARDDMKMKVIENTRPANPAQIHAHVEPGGTKTFFQPLGCRLDKKYIFAPCGWIEYNPCAMGPKDAPYSLTPFPRIS